MNFIVKNVDTLTLTKVSWQGSKSVFVRHYLKENIGEFKSRVLEGNNKMETWLLESFSKQS